jgi:putative membrane protein
MFFEVLFATFAGMFVGIITGITPGIHVNLVAAGITAYGFQLTEIGFSPLILSCFIISLSLTHSYLDAIPSIFLGAPDESQIVSALPGHKYFLEGKGHEAFMYTLIGSFFALILTLLFFPFGIIWLEPMQNFISPYIGKLLVIIVIILIIMSKKILINSLILISSAILGFLCFALPNQNQILLPLLSGLFGTSTLIVSLYGNDFIKEQKIEKEIPLELIDIEKTVPMATFVGIIASFLPGFGTSQGAIFATATMKNPEPKHYLLLTGGINTVNFAFSIMTLYILEKARNGAILAVGEIFGTLDIMSVLIFTCVLIISGSLSVFLGISLSKIFAKFISKINYKKLVKSIIIFVTIIVLILSGLQGMLILITSTSLGLLTNYYKGQKNMLLGCMLIPVITYLW